MKFTFRKQKRETGLAAVARPYSSTVIKHNKLQVGYIHAPDAFTDQHWIIRLRLVDGKQKCGFHWVCVKHKFNSEPEARQWLKTNCEKLLALNLHHMEDDGL